MTMVLQLYDKPMTEKKERFRYPMFSCRASKEVIERLTAMKVLSDKSWDGFLKELLNAKNGERK